MASMPLLFLALLFSSSSCFSNAQTIFASSSSFSRTNPASDSSPAPTKHTIHFWSSLPPSRRTDVPVRITVWDRLTTLNTVEHGQRMTPFPPSSSSSSTPSTQTLRHPTATQPSDHRPRTDMASLEFSRDLRRGGTARKSPASLLPTLPSTFVAEVADVKPVISEEESDKETEDNDSQGLGSGRTPAAAFGEAESPDPLPTWGDEMAQYRLQAQTMISRVADVKAPPPENQTLKPRMFGLTTVITTSTASTPLEPETAALSAAATQQTPQTAELTGKLPASNSSTDEVPPKQDFSATTPPTTTATAPSSTGKRSRTAPMLAAVQNQTSLKPNIWTTQVSHTSTAGVTSTTKEAVGPLSKTTEQTAANTTVQSSKTGTASLLTTIVVPITRSRFAPTYKSNVGARNRSLLGHPQQAPHSTLDPALSPSVSPSFNGTHLYWGDLSRTLAFAWELHVYGSASLFLLLFAGAALGLTLSPGINCPHRGALALANALLFLAGGLRSALFFIDPYGTRKVLPRPAVTALYNLPLHLLVWTQACVALLALRVAGVSVLPSTLERLPLIAVLTVLQSTLLLAADLLSPALSPVVPVTLQVLSICWGLGLCLTFLFYVFPRLRCSSVPHGVPDETRRKTWTGSRRLGVILGRVLALCAVLGALCCGLHVHATLWLYGLLGNWTRFNWGWWLVHFWARLLELAWGFSLLLLASWVFWRPAGCRGREEAGPDGRAAGDLPSPGQSVGSSQRHTCWSKIVQSLRGKPCRKSESNGVGSGGGAGEVPNNWAGQERPGADISKSLIRNQNHEQSSAQTRCIKDNNRGRNHRGQSAERGISGSTGSLLRLQALGRALQRSVSGSLDQDRDTSLSFCEFDLRPPSPIDLTRSIDEALHREHLLGGGSLFHPFEQTSQYPSPGSGISQGPWLRRNSDPQLMSESSEAPTESSMPLGGSILSSVPSRQVTAPPTPSHPGNRWAGKEVISVPSSVSCPVSLRPSRTSTGYLGDDGMDDTTRPFVTPDSESTRGRPGKPVGSRSYLEVRRQDDSASVSSEIIDL